MEREAAELLAKALHLPEEARAAIADSLLESLDTEIDAGAEEAWRDEIHRRLVEIDAAAVEMIPWTEARKRLETRLRR